MPTQIQLMHIIDDVIQAKADASPQFQLGEHIIRRYQQCLYLTGKFADLSQTCLDMPLNQQIALPDNLGTILCNPQCDRHFSQLERKNRFNLLIHKSRFK